MKYRKRTYLLISALVVAVVLAVTVSGIAMQSKKAYDDPSFTNINAASTKVYTKADDTLVALNYVQSEGNEDKVYDVYTDSEGNEYLFDQSGVLCSLRAAEVAPNSQETAALAVASENTPVNLSQATKIAEKHAAAICGDDFEKFEPVDSYYQEAIGEYYFEYRVTYRDGIIGEYCFVTLNDDGGLVHVTRPRQSDLAGFDESILDEIDKTEIDAHIKATLAEQYPDVSFVHNIDKMSIQKIDGEMGIMLYVKATSSGNTQNVEIFYPFA